MSDDNENKKSDWETTQGLPLLQNLERIFKELKDSLEEEVTQLEKQLDEEEG